MSCLTSPPPSCGQIVCGLIILCHQSLSLSANQVDQWSGGLRSEQTRPTLQLPNWLSYSCQKYLPFVVILIYFSLVTVYYILANKISECPALVSKPITSSVITRNVRFSLAHKRSWKVNFAFDLNVNIPPEVEKGLWYLGYLVRFMCQAHFVRLVHTVPELSSRNAQDADGLDLVFPPKLARLLS